MLRGAAQPLREVLGDGILPPQGEAKGLEDSPGLRVEDVQDLGFGI